MIEVEDLSFEYPTTRALDSIDLTVERGAIAALVGPNGAGKTTLLRCLAALERPFSGKVRIDGLDTRRHPRDVHERIGYLPDFFGLYDDLTVRQSLVFAARAHGIASGAADAAAQKAAERTALTDRMNQKASELSRGLRQRLAIGQAIVHEPRVLLLDEPASGLDPEARRSLSRLFLSLQALGITQIVSSHILAELEDYCTHMIIMDQGRIVRSRKVGGQAGGAVPVRIDLVQADERLSSVLSQMPEIQVIEVSGQSAMVVVSDGGAGRSALLRRLVEAGLEVAGIAEVRERLEDAYFSDLEPSEKNRNAGGARP
ncbi:MAG: ABC transporter ATP-binding protein [Alphaproteobacteria bacterium]